MAVSVVGLRALGGSHGLFLYQRGWGSLLAPNNASGDSDLLDWNLLKAFSKAEKWGQSGDKMTEQTKRG